jgi:hypothetical protein
VEKIHPFFSLTVCKPWALCWLNVWFVKKKGIKKKEKEKGAYVLINEPVQVE